MDHDDTYALMMDALDGELATDGKLELEAHLRACPECHEEWRALLAVDQLFRQTPAISPAAGFTQRTLARLPNRKYRVWALGTIYALLLLAGAMPMMIGGWAITRLGPVVNQPVLVRSLLRSIEQMAQVAGTVLAALWQTLGEVVLQQPAAAGWLMVMAGVVVLWSSVYRQLVSQPVRIR